jgi:predicted nucleic acid-binding protein
MCVLDSNIGVKWLLQKHQSDKARVVRDEYARGLHQLLAPDIFTVECAHAFTRAQRQARGKRSAKPYPWCRRPRQARGYKGRTISLGGGGTGDS